MKRYLLIIALIGLVVSACVQDTIRYGGQDNVYFDFSKQGNDTMQVYTFAYTPDRSEDTVYFPVMLAGKRVSHDRTFKVEVDPSNTTAKPETHYKPLESSYTLSADSGICWVPVVVYSKDRNLEDTPVTLGLKLTATEDLSVSFSKSSKSYLSISNRLEKPDWWDVWDGSLGSYSRVKHALYLISVGKIDLITDPIDPEQNGLIPYDLFVIDIFRQFLSDPIGWTDANDKGYVLSERPEGNAYDFYNPSNPYKVYQLKFNDGDGKYYFIDEHNEQVTVN